MAKDIKLSPKHGVNPTIPICFWCGKEKNEIALLGRIGGKKDLEAPKNMVLDFEPCDECTSKMALGITCMECTEKPNPSCNVQLAEQYLPSHIYPTGRYVVIKREAAERIFGEQVDFNKHSKLFVDSVAYNSLFGEYKVDVPGIDTEE